MKNLTVYLALVLATLPFTARGANKYVDSLRQVIVKTGEDTNKVNLLNLIANDMIRTFPDSAFKYVDRAFDLAESLGADGKIAECYSITGNIYRAKHDYAKAIEIHLEVLDIYEEMGVDLGWSIMEVGNDYFWMNKYDTARQYYNEALISFEKNRNLHGRAVSLNNLGMVSQIRGDYLGALGVFIESAEIYEHLERNDGLAWSYELIADVYYHQGEAERALEYLLKTKKIHGKMRNKRGLMQAYLKLGPIYADRGDRSEALDNYSLALRFAEDMGDDLSIAIANNKIGEIYIVKREYARALRHQEKALVIQESVGDKLEMCNTLNSMGQIYIEMVNPEAAIEKLEQSIEVAKAIGYKFILNSSYLKLSEAYSLNKDFKSAYKFHLLYSEIHDEIYDDGTMKNILELQAKYEDKKDQEEILLLTKENRIQELESKKDGIVQYSLFAGFLLLSVVIFLVLNRSRMKQKSMLELEKMNEKMEETIEHRTGELLEQKKRLEASRSSMKIVSEIGRQLTSSLDFETIFINLHQNVSRLMNAECFGVRIYHPNSNVIDYKYEIENGERHEPIDVSMDDDDNYSVWCIKNKKEIFINDNLKEFREYTKKIVTVEGETPHSLLFTPMMIDAKVVGVITVQSFERQAYTKYQADILKTLASYTAVALENAGTFEKLGRKVKSISAKD